MNNSKSIKIINPEDVEEHIHLIGCGSIGSYIGWGLAKLGLANVTLYDFDIVEEKNIGNQVYGHPHIGMKKVEALQNFILDNTGIKYDIKDTKLESDELKLNGIIISAVDSMPTRIELAKKNRLNSRHTQFFDVRAGMYEARAYGLNLTDPDQYEKYMNTTFVIDPNIPEAKELRRYSLCGTRQDMICTSYLLSALCILKLIRFVNMRKGFEVEYGYLNELIIAYQNRIDCIQNTWT